MGLEGGLVALALGWYPGQSRVPLSMPEGRKLQDSTLGDKIQLSYPLAKWMRKLKLWVQNHITVGGMLAPQCCSETEDPICAQFLLVDTSNQGSREDEVISLPAKAQSEGNERGAGSHC